MINAPFNFVPLSPEVYFPEWADQISLDIPFSDECSGQIEFTVTAHTPIFVKDGSKKETKPGEPHTFSQIDGKYFIPATSLKGTIRSVLEILSFGKMRLDKRVKFAQREWYNEELYPLKEKQDDICCGWLIRSKEGYFIEDCGKPYRINHLKIDAYLKSNSFRDAFSSEPGSKMKGSKSLKYKYGLLRSINLKEPLTFSEINNKKVEYDINGKIIGHLVVTGQSGSWQIHDQIKYGTGKFYEFVFPLSSGKRYSISQEEFDHFESIYSKNKEIEFLKGKWDQRVPVFFRKKGQKEEEVLDFGLAYLYKLPYNRSPYHTLPEAHRSAKPDLADCIFGYTGEARALKGRVQFTHAFAIEVVHPDSALNYTLSSPKASYYPIYINQENIQAGGEIYQTYNDGTISGHKRYVLRKKIVPGKEKESFKPQMDTSIIPLPPGTKFQGKIHFHNLRPVELGALLSALTFHGNQGCYHQIGQGKPYGLGQVNVNINLKYVPETPEYYMILFEKEISEKIEGWPSHKRVKELFSLSSVKVNSWDTRFKYMILKQYRKAKEYKKSEETKEPKEYLEAYTKIKNIQQGSISLINNENNK